MKNCSHCQEALRLPIVNFMCGHTYHDSCIEKDKHDKPYCTYCYNDAKNKDIKEK